MFRIHAGEEGTSSTITTMSSVTCSTTRGSTLASSFPTTSFSSVPSSLATTPVVTTHTIVVAKPQMSIISPMGRLPIPYHFPSESIGESTRAAFNGGDRLDTGKRTQLLEALYQDVTTKYTL